jgi:light-regulated signal transduction histidine kinase (bacteriophytochrome)
VTAVDCIKLGAADYVLKDRLARLPEAVRGAIEEQRLRRERQQAQTDLANKVEELARSNRDLEQFAYVASHDLQEPLRMVAAYTQLLAERYRGKLDENADKYIAYAVEGALRMQALIQDLLAFSRLGRSGAVPDCVDCSAVVDEVRQNLRAAIEESSTVIDCGDLPTVNANRMHVIQLFQNLIGNAIKFRGTGKPVITVSGEQQQDGMARFTVADNGIGIAAQHLEVIFVIFQRLHTREEYSGNGVGLAICKRIVEQHGGRIWAESKDGIGTTFGFTLPTSPMQKGQS